VAELVLKMTVQRLFESGLTHHQAGRLVEAIAIYRQVLEQQPDHAEALYMFGSLAAQSGRSDAGIEFFRRAIRIRPDFAEAHNELGIALAKNKQIEEAIVVFRQATQLRPDYVEAHCNLGLALQETEHLAEAIAAYRRSIQLKPDFVEAHHNLGVALARNGQNAEAIAAYRQAIRLRPDYASAHCNLGNSLRKLGQIDEAIVAFGQAIALQPDLAAAHNGLGAALVRGGRLGEAIASFRQAIRCEPGFTGAHDNLVYNLLFHPDYDSEKICEENHLWSQRHAEPMRKFIRPHINDRLPDRRLRIGYVSPCFREHAVGRFILPLLPAHDRDHFEIFCYADVRRSDHFTALLRGLCDGWRSLVGMTDEEAAQKICEDRIDILIDLTLHMAENRLLLFARKPAPVQVTWLGYPGSTGLLAMDYRLTDPYLDPPGMNDQFYSETSVRLPDAYWCYRALANEPRVKPLPAMSTGHITFGCLNNFRKVNEAVQRLWARILGAVDRSRLILLCPEGGQRQLIINLMQREGIDPDRIEMVTDLPFFQYLESYHRIDLGLDPFPYNGGTTTCDALWMGVPVVSLVGKTAVGRAGLSILSNVGLPELVAQTPEQYVQIAVDLARDLPRLSGLRGTLRSRMEMSPLMDAPRFARNVEAAYRQMWRNWCSQ
jgi:protein O-GlcNAc transferase